MNTSSNNPPVLDPPESSLTCCVDVDVAKKNDTSSSYAGADADAAEEISASTPINTVAVLGGSSSPTHVETIEGDGDISDVDRSSLRAADAEATATMTSPFETKLPSSASTEAEASEAAPELAPALAPPSSATTLQLSSSYLPPISPPFLSTKVTSGPAHWDSIKSRLLMLASASMSSSPSPSPSPSPSSSYSSLLQLLSEMCNKNYSTLPTSERSFLLSALLPALSKILVNPNGRAATCIRSAAASGGDGDGGNKEEKKPRKRKGGKLVVAEKSSDSNKIIDTTTTTVAKQSRKKKQQQELPPPRTTPSATMPSPACHVPPDNSDLASSSASPSSSSAAETYTTIRNAALQLLEQLTLQLLFSVPLPPSSSFASHRNDHNVSDSGSIDIFLFRMHAPSIMSIAIHVMMEDTESNALLANNGLLVRILRGYNKSSVLLTMIEGNNGNSSGGSGSAGGKEAIKMLRECQALLNFVVGCYKRLGGSGNGKRKKGANNTYTTKGSDTKTGTSLLVVGGGGDGVLMPTPDKTSTKKAATSSKEGGSIMAMTPETASVVSMAEKNSTTNNTTTTKTTNVSVESSQSYRLLSEMPLTIMLLFHLYPIKLANRNNMANLIPAMMDFLQLQSITTSSSLSSSPGGSGGAGGTVAVTTTPSLSTPQVVVAKKGRGGSSSSKKPSLAAAAALGGGAPTSSVSATAATTNTTMATTPASTSTAYISTPPSAAIAATAATTTLATLKKEEQISSLHELQVQQQTVVACQVKIVSFITHLMLLLTPPSPKITSGGNSNNIPSIVATAAEAPLKLYEDSCATSVLQLLRYTSSSWILSGRGGGASTATIAATTETGSNGGGAIGSTCSAQNLHYQRYAIQLRKELMVNTRHMLSTKYRRGFYRHVDAMLDERLLIGSNNARLSGRGVGGAAAAVAMLGGGLDLGGDGENFIGRGGDCKVNNILDGTTGGGGGAIGYDTATATAEAETTFASLQPLGYIILAEFITQIRTKLTPAQLSRTIRIFSRLLHCDLTTGFFHVPRIITQSELPNLTFPYSDMQIAAAKLLMHLPEIIFHNRDPNPQVGRDLLFRILRSCVHKLEVLSAWIPCLLNDVAESKIGIQKEDRDEQEGGDGTDAASSPSPLTIILNLQLLLRPIIHGMKTLFWCISSYSHQREKERQRSSLAGEEQFPFPSHYALLGSSKHDNSKFFNEELNSGMTKMTMGERELVEDFIRAGIPCLRIFRINVRDELDKQLQPWSSSTSSVDNEKRKMNPGHREILESFAVSFTSLESYNFRVVIANNLPFLLHQMDIEEDNIAMFSHLLVTTGKAVSYEFVEVILGYLMVNVGGLCEYEKKAISSTSSSSSTTISDSQEDGNVRRRPTNTRANSPPPPVLTKRAQNLSKLFQLAFSSLIKYPRNENAFLPHLQNLVKECVQRSMEESPSQSMMGGVCRGDHEGEIDLIWPGPYIDTLRTLFRTISGKFDASYKELLPLVPTLLNNFYRIYNATCSTPLRQVIIEVCLTIPSRLSVLLPHLPLLLKIIIPALNSNMGILTNLALRTLEFWVDNLHPDYLYPIFATQDDDGTGLCELMVALTRHLQPAPYPYGLLCMRLLGKMGGINRLFFREMVGYVDPKRTEGGRSRIVSGGDNMSMYCEWQGEAGDGPSSEMPFLLPFPLGRAVDVLRFVAAAPCITVASYDNHSNQNSPQPLQVSCQNFSELLSVDPRIFDLKRYTIEVMEETKVSQSESAFTILRAALASLLDIDNEEGNGQISVCTKNGVVLTKNDAIVLPSDDEEGPDVVVPPREKTYNRDFKLICDGLYAASNHDDLKDEAMLMLKGLGSHIFYLLLSHRENITRIDRDGCSIDPYHGDGSSGSLDNSQNHTAEKIQFNSFGCFRLSGPLDYGDIDPFVFNEALADAFTDSGVNNSHFAAMAVMHHVVELFHHVKGRAVATSDDDKNEPMDVEVKDVEVKDVGSPTATGNPQPSQDATEWGDIFFENLLSKLCHYCFSQPWNHRTGVMSGLFDLIIKMGLTWSQQYEVEILHTAMFIIKDTPDGIAHASKASVRFFLQVSWFFFDGPSSWKESNTVIHDVLCPMTTDTKSRVDVDDETHPAPTSVKGASLTLILSEIASTKPLVRFVVRHVLRMITRDSASIDTLLSNHVNSLKRLIFPKVLRTLPLPNMCAAVDACAFILDRAPKLIPIVDQNLLAFLSELLKMISIADGEFSDPSFGSVVLIDKNGFAFNNGGESTSQNRSGTHASSIFLRKAIVIEDDSFGGRIQIPRELPLGIQLRVSTLLLFRALIRGFADEFYDADPQSKIGNIRPHVVSLLFRSLISEPAECVASSASALHSALILGKEKEDESSSSKGHRLSKELIQSCIRPILLNLREHTKLSLPLLRGLSHLLVLLSSWFNKTLGEKLIEHLNKFGEPDTIMQLQVFKPGDEPLIAAAVLDLFALLPQASQFVESLVKQTIRLEIALPRYKPCLSASPFRQPLAKYLNRHFANAVSFFLQEHRLCNPVYSNLFQDLLKRDDTVLLRDYLSSNSVMLLNVCFDRPLHIIRSEKTSSPEGKIVAYGINEWCSPSTQRKLEVARQDIELKKKFLALKTQEEARQQKALQSKSDDSNLPEYQSTLLTAHEAVERAKRELDEARNAYARDVSQVSAQNNVSDKIMTITALELQHQGLKLVEILTSLNPQYLQSQNDVVRALRWLWRSRGRHYRLLHEEEIPPRYHCESLALGKFLVSYSKANPADTDVLFDLIRIFLHGGGSSIDFSFIKQFLRWTVSSDNSIEQNMRWTLILQRFSTLLSSEGSEETKILSAQMLAIPTLSKSFFDDSSVEQLTESILKDASYGPKLTCELLQIVAIILERKHSEDMTQYRRSDLLNFVLAVLKNNDDAGTKYYAHIAVSRFIAGFDNESDAARGILYEPCCDKTPTDPCKLCSYPAGCEDEDRGGVSVILQVYYSILRDTSAREALDVLLPALKKRLGNDELETALKYSIQVVCNDNNSIPQRAHIWVSVTRHPEDYDSHKSELMPHMLQWLSLLTLQPAVPLELVKLSADIAKLFFDWVLAGRSTESREDLTGLDENTVDSFVNNLVRLAFLTAAGRPDRLRRRLQLQILSLLKDFVSYQRNCTINPSPFENSLLHEARAGEESKIKKGETNSSESIREEVSDSKAGVGEGVNMLALRLCAEIILILLQNDPTNAFIDQYGTIIVNQCFAHAKSSLAQNIEDIIIHLLVNGHGSSETISYIVAMLERALRKGTCDQKKLAISVTEKVCEMNRDFIEQFSSSLTVLVDELAAQHVKEQINKTSNAFVMHQMAENGHQHQLSATPTIGIFEAACGLGFTPSSLGKDVQLSNCGFKNQIVVENETLSMSLQSLIHGMRLVASSDSLFTFSSKRIKFMKTLSTILDFSCSIPVLMTAVSIIGQWITANGHKMPLTKSEYEGFLWQLCLLDFKRLPETSSHALNDLICCIVLSSYGENSSMIQEYPLGLDKSFFLAKHYLRDRVANDENFQKLFVPCLLSGNPYIRSLSMGIISMQLDNCKKDGSIHTVGISNRCTSDILMSLLQLDYESIGERLWTTVVVDALLASCKYDTGGVHLCRQGLDHQVFATQMKGCMLLPGYMRMNHKKSILSDHTVIFRPDEHDGVYSPFLKILESQRSDKLCGRGRCIAAVRNLVHGDTDTCQSLLELCFQSVWQSLPDNQTRASLVKPLERLIARPFHSQGVKSYCGQMNAVQSMLRLLVRLRPMPFIDHFLLQSLAVNYNVRNEAICLLERQYISMKTLNSSSHDLIKAAQKCYDSLGDRDVSLAISSAMAQFPGTKFALSLDMYDLVNESTNAYLSLIDRADRSDAEFLPSENDLELWEARWVESHKQMGQWSVVDEFASSTSDATLMLECAWKTNNWEKVKSLCVLPSVVASLDEDDPLTKITEIYLAIHEGNLGEVENLHWQSAQLCLRRWNLLPSVGAGGNAHISIFQQFQRLVELRESSQIAMETSSHSARRTIPDLKLLLSSWRHRLPNSFERVSQWDDIFIWRLQIFDAIARNFSWTNDPNAIATLHDRPFVCISLGRAARKQGLKEVATYSLNSLTESAMSGEYEFLKLREHVVTNQFSSAESLKCGLNLVNSTNLSFFDSRQKAEMFRLKAYFFYELNEKPKSNQAYCHAVQICPTYARAWVDWGLLCASLSDDAQKQSRDEKADSKELSKKTGLYLVQAMGCFLEAVLCDPTEQSRDHIPYCLSMLANDGPTYGNLCRTFETRSAVLPSWVFLPWIPQLLTSLCRIEARAVKAILVGIMKDHPQAIYYSLRSFYLERRDIERSTAPKATPPNDDDTLTSSRLAEELMSNLRKVHPVLWSRLESILEDLIVRFRPSYEAELMHSISALLEKASKPEYKTSKDSKDSGTEISGHLDACTKTLHLLGTKFFNLSKEKPDSAITRKAALFQSKYCDEFKRDFLLEKEGLKCDDLVAKLHKWKKLLERGISRVPKTSSLQEVSPSLSWFSCQAPDLWAGACESMSLNVSNSQHDAHSSLDNTLFHAKRSSALAVAKASSQAVLVAANAEGIGGHSGAAVVEIPGQYAPTSSSILDSRPIPELHAKLVRFHQTLELTSSSTKQHVHQITMIGSDGKMYKFLLQLAIPYWIRTDERSAQVKYVIRKTLRRDYRACRRSLTIRPSVVIPVAQRMRMSANQSSHESLDSIFCSVQGPKTNMLPAYFQEKVTETAALRVHALGESERDNDAQVLNQVKLDVYHDICHKLVLPNVLSKYMSRMISSTEHLYRFRHVFSSQLAANSLLQYALAIVERTPNRFAFCNASGQMISQDFRSQYNHGLLEKHDVPFRLTRNITEFIGPFLLEGVLIPSFVIISSALHAKQKLLEPVLHLLLRDDVMAWYISKSSAKNDQKMQEVERQLSDRIWSNVHFVQDRFEECSPRVVEDAAAEAIKPNPDPIDIKVRSLINAATSAEKLSLMPPAYQPWL